MAQAAVASNDSFCVGDPLCGRGIGEGFEDIDAPASRDRAAPRLGDIRLDRSREEGAKAYEEVARGVIGGYLLVGDQIFVCRVIFCSNPFSWKIVEGE